MDKARRIQIYDTTLRDGCQAEGIFFTLEDKLMLAARLDELGVDYIEGGYPLSNPKDEEFFREVPSLGLRSARVAAFGSTRKAGGKAVDDRGLQALLSAQTPVVTIVAKAWDLHVTNVLRTDCDETLRMIEDSIRLVKSEGREVILDAEHFFDGYASNRDFAMKVVEVSFDSGADCVVLCDTNGGSLTDTVGAVTGEVVENFSAPIGIHCHDDSGLAIANSIAAVQNGAVQVQGTLNGFGERCGNADICAIIPIVNLKTPFRCISPDGQRKLTEISRYAYELANMMFRSNQPFVGASAFAHKGGLHVDGMRKDEHAYEHEDPAAVGNERRFLLSELSGRATVLEKVGKYDLTDDREAMVRLLKRLQDLENEGYQFEAAEASFELMAMKETGRYRRFFGVEGYHVSSIKQSDGRLVTDAAVKIDVAGHREHTAAEGDGPVNALDGALRKALERHYPCLRDVHLVDYRVRVINPRAATAAKVRVVIQSSDNGKVWGTVGVSENIIDASWLALIDSIEYKLLISEGMGAQSASAT